MEWIIKMIEPVIKDCKTPEEAEKAIIEWGRSQEPRDAAIALIAVKFMNEHYYRATGQSDGSLNF